MSIFLIATTTSTLQLSLYAYILETEYEYYVSAMYLCVVHPDIEKGRCIEVPRLRAEIEAVVEYEGA